MTLNRKRKIQDDISSDDLRNYDSLDFFRKIKKPDSVSLYQALQGPICQNYDYTAKLEFFRDGQLVKLVRVFKGNLKILP